MSLGVAGLGWVTPLGSGIDLVWNRLLTGEEASAETLSGESIERSYPVFRVPNKVLAGLPSHPRLRRVSPISRFAAAAGLEALANARLKLDADEAQRTALVFAISNGGVIYTRRFYNDIISSGAQAASPLLFPETVFNAAASHLAALLDISGASYTIVGDGAVGILAMKMAEDLMLADLSLDYCLVVGTEEVDWLLCDAYWRCRLLRSSPPLEVFGKTTRGTVLSEGAGAVLLARDASVMLDATSSGGAYRSWRESRELLREIILDLTAGDIGVVVASANGTFVDRAEAGAIRESVADGLVYTVKPALGESVGA
ncbi:MAG TPA: beta-ketoacyl synthase N-terminal-like domain-containing protein, partial [Chthoniobacterales bacterium]|nr:beta-ketoacyl synthase N-terminal-like domain-containing protein [Chthoniobacterales bacterium]